MITIALSKGRIFTETMPMLNAAGIFCKDDPDESRKLGFDAVVTVLRSHVATS